MTDTTNRITGKENPSLSNASAGRVLIEESVHLPECLDGLTPEEIKTLTVTPENCDLCNRLRACEQRVRSETCDSTSAEADAYSVGLTAGLHAAWEAIEALPKMKIAGNFPLCDTDDALAAIDSLRGDK